MGTGYGVQSCEKYPVNLCAGNTRQRYGPSRISRLIESPPLRVPRLWMDTSYLCKRYVGASMCVVTMPKQPRVVPVLPWLRSGCHCATCGTRGPASNDRLEWHHGIMALRLGRRVVSRLRGRSRARDRRHDTLRIMAPFRRNATGVWTRPVCVGV